MLLFKCDVLAIALLRIEILPSFLPSVIETKLPQNLDKNINSMLISIPLRFPKNSQRIPKEFPNLCTANYEVINKFELAIQGS